MPAFKPLYWMGNTIWKPVYNPFLNQGSDFLRQALDELNEILWHPQTQVNVSLDPSSSINGEIFQGSGNNDDNFVKQLNTQLDIEGGLRLHYRQGDNLAPAHTDEFGRVHFYAPAGSQVADPDHGVFATNAARWAWSYTIDLNSGVDGGTKTLEQWMNKGAEFWLARDLDPTENVHFQYLKLVQSPTSQSGYGWDDPTTPGIDINDNEGLTFRGFVDQQDQNGAFSANLFDHSKQAGFQGDNNNIGAEHNLELIGRYHGHEILHIELVVHSVDPETIPPLVGAPAPTFDLLV